MTESWSILLWWWWTMLLETHTLELLLTGPESCLILRSSAVITLVFLAYPAKKESSWSCLSGGLWPLQGLAQGAEKESRWSCLPGWLWPLQSKVGRQDDMGCNGRDDREISLSLVGWVAVERLPQVTSPADSTTESVKGSEHSVLARRKWKGRYYFLSSASTRGASIFPWLRVQGETVEFYLQVQRSILPSMLRSEQAVAVCNTSQHLRGFSKWSPPSESVTVQRLSCPRLQSIKSHGQTPLSFGVYIDKGRRIGKREKVYLSLTSKPCNAMDRSQETRSLCSYESWHGTNLHVIPNHMEAILWHQTKG